MDVVCVAFAVLFAVIVARLVMFGLADPRSALASAPPPSLHRPDVVDRHGRLLATDLPAVSLFAVPKDMVDVEEAVDGLRGVFPDLDEARLRQKLGSGSGFVWIKRKISSAQQRAVHMLGLPGVGFRPEFQRFYPNGAETSHVLGLTDIDNRGVSGFEKWIDLQETEGTAARAAHALNGTIRASIDLRAQHALQDELAIALKKYRAAAVGGVILDVRSGEILALASLPDFDPAAPEQALLPDRINRMTGSAAEMGSTFKTFTTAMAMEIGGASTDTLYDASRPIVVGRQRVRDPHPKGRPLSVAEIFRFSSNIGSAQEAEAVGVTAHREFLNRLGLLSRLRLELPETAFPLQPRTWSVATSITASFGHGVATTPLQTASAVAGILSGRLVPPTLLARTEQDVDALAKPVVGRKTSSAMRHLYRLNAEVGSARQANVPGYRVGGKTGTAEKVIAGRYAKSHNFNTFAAALPMEDPRLVYFVIVDDPRPDENGQGVTSAANAAPTAGAIIARTAFMLGVAPASDDAPTGAVVQR